MWIFFQADYNQYSFIYISKLGDGTILSSVTFEKLILFQSIETRLFLMSAPRQWNCTSRQFYFYLTVLDSVASSIFKVKQKQRKPNELLHISSNCTTGIHKTPVINGTSGC